MKAEQQQGGDRRRGQGVARVPRPKKHRAPQHQQCGLHQLARKQLDHRPPEREPHRRALGALHQPRLRGRVLRLAHEHNGQQDPVAVRVRSGLHEGKAHHEGQAQPQAVAQPGGLQLPV